MNKVLVDYGSWLLIVAMVLGAQWLIGYFHLSTKTSAFFVWGSVFFACLALFLLTSQGKLFKKQAREAREEVYKVVWPAFDDVFRTTIMIAVAVSISLFLWFLDSILMKVYNLVL